MQRLQAQAGHHAGVGPGRIGRGRRAGLQVFAHGRHLLGGRGLVALLVVKVATPRPRPKGCPQPHQAHHLLPGGLPHGGWALAGRRGQAGVAGRAAHQQQLPSQRGQQGAFARAAGPHQRQVLARLDAQAEVLKQEMLTLAHHHVFQR